MKAIISGGGTGGHIFPAIAIANALKQKDPDTEILFIGAEGRMEMEKVPAAGYQIIGLEVAGFQRKLTLKNIQVLIKAFKSSRKAKKIIREFAPDVVIGVGGYASGPTLRMASKLGIPCLIQEQNSYPGITNKLLARRVKKICVAYPNMEQFFPKNKIVLTGNPIRQDIADIQNKRTEAFEYFKLNPDKKTVLIIGGSLGARTINESILHNITNFVGNDIQLIWQSGKSFFAEHAESMKQVKTCTFTDFITRMDLAYAAADIIVSRAGALSISEICAVGKPAIFIPSPNVTEDHQTKNAMALVNREAALMVKDSDAINELWPALENLINDKNKQQTISKNCKTMAKIHAAAEIVNEIYKIINC